MKSRRVEDILKSRGLEQGTAYILSYLVERMNSLEKSVTEVAQMQLKMIETMDNVVNGAVGMKQEMQRALQKAGLTESEDPDEQEGHLQ